MVLAPELVLLAPIKQIDVCAQGRCRSKRMKKSGGRFLAFGFGIIFVVVLLILAIEFPNPTPFQHTVFRIVLALAAGGVAAMIPGFLTIEVSKWLRARRALGVFVNVYFYSPA